MGKLLRESCVLFRTRADIWTLVQFFRPAGQTIAGNYKCACSCRVGVTIYLHVTAMKVCSPGLACFTVTVYLSMWAAEYVARRDLVKAGRKSLKQQRWSEQLSGLADRRVDEQ